MERNVNNSEWGPGWFVARDEDGKLHLFQYEPNKVKRRNGHGYWMSHGNAIELKAPIDPSLFPIVKWEDECAWQVELAITLKR